MYRRRDWMSWWHHGGAAAFPGAPVTIWTRMFGLRRDHQRGPYQPFILIMQVLAMSCWYLDGSGKTRQSAISYRRSGGAARSRGFGRRLAALPGLQRPPVVDSGERDVAAFRGSACSIDGSGLDCACQHPCAPRTLPRHVPRRQSRADHRRRTRPGLRICPRPRRGRRARRRRRRRRTAPSRGRPATAPSA